MPVILRCEHEIPASTGIPLWSLSVSHLSEWKCFLGPGTPEVANGLGSRSSCGVPVAGAALFLMWLHKAKPHLLNSAGLPVVCWLSAFTLGLQESLLPCFPNVTRWSSFQSLAISWLYNLPQNSCCPCYTTMNRILIGLTAIKHSLWTLRWKWCISFLLPEGSSAVRRGFFFKM